MKVTPRAEGEELSRSQKERREGHFKGSEMCIQNTEMRTVTIAGASGEVGVFRNEAAQVVLIQWF